LHPDAGFGDRVLFFIPPTTTTTTSTTITVIAIVYASVRTINITITITITTTTTTNLMVTTMYAPRLLLLSLETQNLLVLFLCQIT
jgi:hypothetical protein